MLYFDCSTVSLIFQKHPKSELLVTGLQMLNLKGPTHYTPYGIQCRVDRNFSIIMQNLAIHETRNKVS